jgi:hypothetical protein
MYLQEISFYRELSGRPGIGIPRCYFAGGNQERTGFLLLLEDLRERTFGDQLAGCWLSALSSRLSAYATNPSCVAFLNDLYIRVTGACAEFVMLSTLRSAMSVRERIWSVKYLICNRILLKIYLY